MITKATSDDFANIVNPYTGKPMEVFMNVADDGQVTFFSPDTYSPSDRFDTAELCYRKWSRINGVENRKAGKPICCAYTGEALALVPSAFGGFHYVGGFDPHVFHSREEFLYYATMRDGVATREAPGGSESFARVKVPTREGRITDAAKKHADDAAPKLDTEKMHMIENSLKPFKNDLPGSSTVSMSVTRKSNGRRSHGKQR